MGAGRVTQIVAGALVEQRVSGGTLPQSLCGACLLAVPVDGVGLALVTDRGPAGLVGSTGGRVKVVEDLQLLMGEGPSVDAWTQRRPVLQPQLRQTGMSRWLGFGPAAVDAGVEAIFAFPLLVGGLPLGVLTLHRTTAGDLTGAGLDEALSSAAAAVRVLLHLQDQVPLDGGVHPDLTDPSPDQARMHQATGMISAQAGVTPTEALLLLRARAYSSDSTIADLVARVLARTQQFPPL